jgi:dienelactone hydrolase
MLRNRLVTGSALVLLLITFGVGVIFAQEADDGQPPAPTEAPVGEPPVGEPPAATPEPFQPLEVTLEAPDGQTLYGWYSSAGEGEGRGVVLLHQLYTTHTSWNTFAQTLMDSGYKVLSVDLRGYGKTRGRISWTAAQDDAVAWIAWLKSQPGVTSVSVVGSSMGSTIALLGCAKSDQCASAVALSPGLDYYQIDTTTALQDGFPALLVYADRDPYPSQDVPEMQELGGAHIEALTYEGRDHGVSLFKAHDDLMGILIDWLNNHS